MLHSPIVTMAPVTRQAAARAATTRDAPQLSNTESVTEKWSYERDFWGKLTPERRRELEEETERYHVYLQEHPESEEKNKRWHRRLDNAAKKFGLSGCR